MAAAKKQWFHESKYKGVLFEGSYVYVDVKTKEGKVKERVFELVSQSGRTIVKSFESHEDARSKGWKTK